MIYFEKVRFKNFGSFGNTYTEVNLEKSPMTLVSGNNGHGKSFALLDSITFALFGKPFRKINIPQLVNSINQKDCVVELKFRINENKYKIVRGLKPKVFEIYKDNKLIDQHAKAKDYQKMLEEQIIRMNYKSFTQVVILGSSSFVPFMQLTAADRREVIEDILDINIFSTMNTLLKEKIAILKEEIKENDRKRDIAVNKIEMQKSHIKTLEEKSKKSIDDFDTRINESLNDQRLLQEKSDQSIVVIDDLLKTVEDRDSVSGKIGKIEKLITQVENKQTRYEKQLDDVRGKNTCGECGQKIPQEMIDNMVGDTQEKLDELKSGLTEMTTELNKLLSRNEEINAVLTNVQMLQKELNELNGKINASNQHIRNLQKMREQVSSDTGSIDEENEKLNSYMEDEETIQKERRQLVGMGDSYAVAYSLLKDSGIKSKIIKHYLPIINKLINHYLTSMDFFAQFHLDEEFNETIKSRHRDAFSYMSFSEGEKLRIDLSLLLAWREIARLKNSANCNLLILDEVFDSSLDGMGTDEFMKLLHSLGKKCNIFVISHKADHLADKFPVMMGFEKKGDFSRIVK